MVDRWIKCLIAGLHNCNLVRDFTISRADCNSSRTIFLLGVGCNTESQLLALVCAGVFNPCNPTAVDVDVKLDIVPNLNLNISAVTTDCIAILSNYNCIFLRLGNGNSLRPIIFTIGNDDLSLSRLIAVICVILVVQDVVSQCSCLYSPQPISAWLAYCKVDICLNLDSERSALGTNCNIFIADYKKIFLLLTNLYCLCKFAIF